MKDFLKRNSIFIALSLILVGVLGFALVYFPKGELHLLLCDHHTPARDAFFTYYTRVAEYLPYIICVLVLLFGRLGNAAMASACIACSELTTQLLKHIINAPRPITWFAANLPDIQLPLVEGVHMNQWLSFPSGHTTSFFSLFFVLSILATKSLTGTESAGLTAQRSVFCQRSGPAAAIHCSNYWRLQPHLSKPTFCSRCVRWNHRRIAYFHRRLCRFKSFRGPKMVQLPPFEQKNDLKCKKNAKIFGHVKKKQ